LHSKHSLTPFLKAQVAVLQNLLSFGVHPTSPLGHLLVTIRGHFSQAIPHTPIFIKYYLNLIIVHSNEIQLLKHFYRTSKPLFSIPWQCLMITSQACNYQSWLAAQGLASRFLFLLFEYRYPRASLYPRPNDALFNAAGSVRAIVTFQLHQCRVSFLED